MRLHIEKRFDVFSDGLPQQRTSRISKMHAIRLEVVWVDNFKQIIDWNPKRFRNSDGNSVVSVDIGFQPIKPFPLVMPRFIHGSRRRPNYGAMRFRQNTSNDSPHVRFIFIERDSGLGGI